MGVERESGGGEKRKGEEHRGERGERVARVGFAGSPLLIFPVRLAASSFRSWSSFFPPQSHSRCLFPLFPWRSRPRVSGPSPPPSFPFSLARSLFALLLVNALPPFDSRSVLSLSFSPSFFLLSSPYSPFAFEDLSLFFLVFLV